jgi:hypothetical protein
MMNVVEHAGVVGEPLDVGEVVTIDETVESYVADGRRLSALTESIAAGNVVVFKSFAGSEEIERLKRYLHGVMVTSMEHYVARSEGAGNFFRISFDDERAVVRGWFCSWSFFPWNQDLLMLYDRYAPVYRLRNLISGLPPQTFLGRHAEMGCCARLAGQFYPGGKGYMAAHTDPYDRHQVVVPIMPMSKRGRDFQTGGSFVARRDGERLYTEDFVDPGDILLFHSRLVHGVETVDEGLDYDPLSPVGRWMFLFSVNKLVDNTAIADAVMVS